MSIGKIDHPGWQVSYTASFTPLCEPKLVARCGPYALTGRPEFVQRVMKRWQERGLIHVRPGRVQTEPTDD